MAIFLYLNLFPSKISDFITEQRSFLFYILPPKRRKLEEKYEQAKKEIKELGKLIPVCLKCKKVKDAEGNWMEIDTYLRKNSDIDLSHGYCDNCLKEEFPEYADELIRHVEEDKTIK